MTRYLLLLSIAALAVSAGELTAQVTTPQIATDSTGACADAISYPKGHPIGPDIWTYHPPEFKPNPNAITSPKIVRFVAPDFPVSALTKRISGTTDIALLVDTNGQPQQVHVEKSLGPEFDKAAIAVAKQWRFSPALQHGKPVQVKICVSITIP